jgi:hypothetical protein
VHFGQPGDGGGELARFGEAGDGGGPTSEPDRTLRRFG